MKKLLMISMIGLMCSAAWALPETAVVMLSFDTTDGSGGSSSENTTTTLDYDTRDYQLQITSLHGTPDPSVGIHSYPWQSTVTCDVDNVVLDGGINYMCEGWTIDPGASGAGNGIVLKLSSINTQLAWLWRAIASGDGDGDGFDDVWEASVGLYPGYDDSAIVNYITNNESVFGLYSSNAVLDLRLGDIGIVTTNGFADLDLQLEQSDDLDVWTNAGDAVFWSLPVSDYKKFYRVRASP